MKIFDDYFGKAILLILLSVVAFYVLKQILPERLFSDYGRDGDSVVLDSLINDVASDTISTVKQVKVDSVAIDQNFDPTLSVDGHSNLSRFYRKLEALQKDNTQKVRIAYYGDSMNDGDYIVQDVRSSFQDKYGGQGVGFVPFTSLSSGARGSVTHLYSQNWITQSFIKTKKPARPFGIDGQVFFAPNRTQTYWLNFQAQAQKHSTMLNKPTLFFGKSYNKQGKIAVQVDKAPQISLKLQTDNLLNTLPLCEDAKAIKVAFALSDSIPFYGFNFDDGVGVHVDNFSIRGNSGLPLSMLNVDLMNAFDKELNYDLIVLHYGANVLNYGTLDYNWYEKSMTAVIKNLQACFPNADILVVATADKSSKVGGVMQTNPAVVPLAESQKRFARNTRSGYVNLYELMGGNGSMVSWVNNKMANTDYTHFNFSGSKKIAGLIFEEIEKGYSKHRGDKVE